MAILTAVIVFGMTKNLGYALIALATVVLLKVFAKSKYNKFSKPKQDCTIEMYEKQMELLEVVMLSSPFFLFIFTYYTKNILTAMLLFVILYIVMLSQANCVLEQHGDDDKN